MSDLAKRLVAHPVWSMPGFGWQTGMVDCDGFVAEGPDKYDPEQLIGEGDLPDIDHPATKGWLLHQGAVMLWPDYGDAAWASMISARCIYPSFECGEGIAWWWLSCADRKQARETAQ